MSSNTGRIWATLGPTTGQGTTAKGSSRQNPGSGPSSAFNTSVYRRTETRRLGPSWQNVFCSDPFGPRTHELSENRTMRDRELDTIGDLYGAVTAVLGMIMVSWLCFIKNLMFPGTR